MRSSFNKHVGLRVLEFKDGASLIALRVEPQHLNGNGVVHGGVMFTMADTGMGAALLSTLVEGERCATIELKINYFRPVPGGELHCRSQLVHRGRTTAYLESVVSVDATVVGKAVGTFTILRPGAVAPASAQ